MDADADDDALVHRVHGLSDLELAVLLSLVSKEHCLIGTPAVAVSDVAEKLCLIATRVFGLQCAVATCHENTTLEEFTASLVLPSQEPPTIARRTASRDGMRDTSQDRNRNGSRDRAQRNDNSSPDARSPNKCRAVDFGLPHSSISPLPLLPPLASLFAPTTLTPGTSPGAASQLPSVDPTLPVANVVVAVNLNRAPMAVQVQVLELLRAARMAAPSMPRPFLLIGVVAANPAFQCEAADPVRANGKSPLRDTEPQMNGHLNDLFSIGHWHDPEDLLPNLEEAGKKTAEERGDRSAASASRKCASSMSLPLFFQEADIRRLQTMSKAVQVDVDVLRYQMNVVAFLRMHRAVAVVTPSASGLSCVSPTSTRHFQKLAQCLAPLHHLDYVTPALVALAAQKVYLHRIRTVPVAEPEKRNCSTHAAGVTDTYERSLQWGSEPEAVAALLQGITPQDVIDDVLASVVPPV